MLCAFAAAGAYWNRGTLALKIKSVFVRVPPKVSQTLPPAERPHVNVSGDAPWALSALPACFSPQSKTTGPPKFVLAHMPAHLAEARTGAQFRYGNCSLRVAGETIYVDRGGDHLRIPPPSALYYGNGVVALLRAGEGGYDLRVYQPAPGGPVSP